MGNTLLSLWKIRTVASLGKRNISRAHIYWSITEHFSTWVISFSSFPSGWFGKKKMANGFSSFIGIVSNRLANILLHLLNPHVYCCNEFKFQVLCGILQGLVMYEYISSIRLQSFENLDGTPMSYLHVATYIASFFYVLFFIYVFWAKRKLFKRMLEGIQNLEFAKHPGKYAFIKVNI